MSGNLIPAGAKALVFDADGTLLNSMGECRSGQHCRAHGWEEEKKHYGCCCRVPLWDMEKDVHQVRDRTLSVSHGRAYLVSWTMLTCPIHNRHIFQATLFCWKHHIEYWVICPTIKSLSYRARNTVLIIIIIIKRRSGINPIPPTVIDRD